MSTINYTYNVIVDRFRQFAAGHFQLRRFTHGEISQADLEKEAEWPWLHVKPRAINYSPGTRSFSFEIFISDLPRDKEDKTGYQAESITDCSLIFQDLINEIYLGNMFGDQVVLSRPVNSEPFVEQYTHTLTGVTGIVELNLDYDWSACSIPASWNYNTPTDSPSDGWGALQFIESLDQNGVFVSLLNDEEAPGNSYYYGTNASGVKGWYAIVDNIGLTCETLPDCAVIISIEDDIAALQTDVALKANTADLGATAFSNDYGDLDNLPTIPAAQVNSDWNATSGVAEILNKPTIPTSLPPSGAAGGDLQGTYPNPTVHRVHGVDFQSGAPAVDDTWIYVSTPLGPQPFQWQHSKLKTSQVQNDSTVTGTNADDALEHLDSTKVPTTRTLTINGTTQDLSANRTWTIATGLTVGTTPITSGTVGRILFEGTGNVLQQSANFFWDNTNSRLGIGTATPAYGVDIAGAIGAASSIRTGWGVYSRYLINPTATATYIEFQPSTHQINFGINGSEAIRIPSTRNVLIGTTTDGGARLQVKSSAINTDVISILNTSNASLFRVFNGGSGQAIVDIGGTVFLRSDAGLSYINSGGNFGIGTSTDAGYKLDVNGTARISGTTLTLSANNPQLIWNTGAFGLYNGSTRLLRVDYLGNYQFQQSIIVAASSGTAINASAILEANSTTKGFLPPRMTNAQRLAIATPAVGLIVYCTDVVEGLYINKSTGWTFVI